MDDLDALLLGQPVLFTREDVERLSGVSADLSHDVWAAMGFADVPYGEKAFTQLDVEALKTAGSLLELGVIDQSTLLVMARTMGQGLSRLAEAQVDVFRATAAGMTFDEAITVLANQADEVFPKINELVLFVWRRQFAAAVQRTLAAGDEGMPIVSVGFLDLVNFTRSSREWDITQLEQTLEHFERDTALRVTAVGGRVIKTLGDGLLFTADRPLDAVTVALDTIAAHEADEGLPAVRAGVAAGPVLVRLGDVFGEPVNIASRLSHEARPDSLLVDKHVADLLGEEYVVSQLRRRSVRGYRSFTPYLVRR